MVQGSGVGLRQSIFHRPNRLFDNFGLSLAVMLGFLLSSGPISDNSFLTHLSTGRIMVDSGKVPLVDPYSGDFLGDPWVVQSWMASWLYGTVESFAGAGGIRVVHGLCGALLLGLLHSILSATGSPYRAVTFIMTAVVLSPFMTHRPGHFALLLLLVLIWALTRQHRGVAFITAILWAALHGSWPLAPLVALAVAVGFLLDSDRTPDERRSVAASAGVILVTTPASVLLGRLGWSGLVFPFEMLSSDATEGVAEWRSTLPTAVDGSPTSIMFVLILLTALLLGRHLWKSPSLSVLAVGLSVLGVATFRHIPFAVLAIALAVTSSTSPNAPRSVRFAPKPISLRLFIGLCTVVIGCAFVVSSESVNFEDYPVVVVDELNDSGVFSSGLNVVYPSRVGNYLTYLYGPDASVWMDDRFDFYPQSRRSENLQLGRASSWPEMFSVLGQLDADVAIVRNPASNPFVESDHEWRVLAEGDGWIALRRYND